jgi:hypothetical protein
LFVVVHTLHFAIDEEEEEEERIQACQLLVD